MFISKWWAISQIVVHAWMAIGFIVCVNRTHLKSAMREQRLAAIFPSVLCVAHCIRDRSIFFLNGTAIKLFLIGFFLKKKI